MRHPLDIHCPLCEAEAGQLCVGKSGRERKAFHRARGTRRAAPHPVYYRKVENTESPLEAALVRTVREWIEFNGFLSDVTTQAPIGPYRADILIEEDGRKLVVECDGAEFHAVTKEQVERDKRRDRYCVARGIYVMRFTGAEITKDPRGCAAEIGCWIKQA
jgi:very-short-patch-repair endonuclease